MADNNPYIGPASFDEKDRSHFFGRDQEARDLSYLLIARQAVLLYAQSGAGKTSLLQAKVIPDFRDANEMHVLPIARVSGPAEGANVYLANALLRLKLTGATLTEALAPVLCEEPAPGGKPENEEPVPHLLIFDQFEEIFTFRPELADQRRQFFEQLRDCLKTYPRLGLLLSMREDFLADMDSFSGYLPDRLRTRMRMERLSDVQAEQAIAQPAAIAGKPFDPGVARSLTDDLRRVQTTHADTHALGKYVEPVQLQIVCRQLWQKLPATAATITAGHVKALARVDDALTGFYRDSLTAVREQLPALSERTLRTWFGTHLITSANTRGMVYRGTKETETLPNAAVDILASKYIIRADVRPSGTWYELAHDRLLEPVVADNLKWRATYKNPVADAYERWKAAGSNLDKLLSGTLLTEASAFAAKNPSEITKQESDFLATSVVEDRKARQARRIKWTIAAAVLIVVLALAIVATWQGIEAKQNLAQVQKFVAQAMVEEAYINSREKPNQSLAYLADALARNPSNTQARLWTSSILLDHARWLPVSSATVFTPDPSLTLALQKDGSIAISANNQVKATVVDPKATVAAFSPDGTLCTATAAGSPGICWQVTNTPVVLPPVAPTGLPDMVAFTPDGRQLITRANNTELWDLQTGKLVKQLFQGQAYDVSADGRYFLMPDGAGFTRRVNVATQARDPQVPVGDRATLSPAGDYIATFDKAGNVQFWTAATGQKLSAVQSDISDAPEGASLPLASFASGSRVAIGDSKTVTLYDAATGKAISEPVPLTNHLESLALNPDGLSVAIVTAPGLLMVWDTNAVRITPPMMDGEFLAEVKFSFDGKHLLTRAADHARLWDIDTGQTVSLIINESGMRDVAFSPDGQMIATAADKVHTHPVWLDSALLPELAAATGGYTLDSNNKPALLPIDEWIRRVAALKTKFKSPYFDLNGK